MPQEPKFLTADQVLLTTLIVKIAVVALLAIVLVRYHRFRHILLSERRMWPERLVFALSFGIPLSAGVASRLLLNYNAADLSLSGSFVAGLIAGPYAGALVGLMAGLPAAIAHQYIALPFAVGCGFAGGGLRELCPKEAIWHFSPFVFTTLHTRAWRMIRLQVDWQVVLVLAPVGLELIRQALGHRWPSRIFILGSTSPWLSVVVIIATVICVATPIKIWNNARIEHKLHEQEKLLLAARIDALSSQINPHFLFNTLTSIASLIRSDPETARLVINKLSNILRRLLRSQDHFVTLREELESVDEYLDIEVVRFGSNLVVDKHISPDTLDMIVPSMILQPLVENSIKHGLSPKVGGGRITLRSLRENGHAVIEVEDDGLGMPATGREPTEGTGIGLANVTERLRVIYGTNYHLKLTSEPGRGTCVRIEIPEFATPDLLST
ncbi:MAG: histidine kinase [Acidobacteria bacterium]|nr:histidine kinase [Acidobacteriota bacterium]